MSRRNSAAAAPSTTRWSLESVSAMRRPGTMAPFSTTGTSSMAPTARMHAAGGLMIAVKCFDAEHPEVRDGERRARIVSGASFFPRAFSTSSFTSREIMPRLFLWQSLMTGVISPSGNATATPMSHGGVPADEVPLPGGVHLGVSRERERRGLDDEIVVGDLEAVDRVQVLRWPRTAALHVDLHCHVVVRSRALGLAQALRDDACRMEECGDVLSPAPGAARPRPEARPRARRRLAAPPAALPQPRASARPSRCPA